MFTHLVTGLLLLYLKSVCRSNANVGRYSVSKLHFDDVTDDKFFSTNIDLLATSDDYRVLQ